MFPFSGSYSMFRISFEAYSMFPNYPLCSPRADQIAPGGGPDFLSLDKLHLVLFTPNQKQTCSSWRWGGEDIVVFTGLAKYGILAVL